MAFHIALLLLHVCAFVLRGDVTHCALPLSNLHLDRRLCRSLPPEGDQDRHAVTEPDVTWPPCLDPLGNTLAEPCSSVQHKARLSLL